MNENGLLWNGTNCNGECMETFGGVGGPNGGTRFE